MGFNCWENVLHSRSTSFYQVLGCAVWGEWGDEREEAVTGSCPGADGVVEAQWATVGL